MSYRKLLENLEALPEGERQLAYAHYVFRDASGAAICGCVLGKGLAGLRSLPAEQNKVAISTIWSLLGDRIGLTRDEAQQAQWVNDDHMPHGRAYDNSSEGRRARYLYMVEWLRARVAEEGNAAVGRPQGSQP